MESGDTQRNQAGVALSSLASLLTAADRERLVKRLAELRELDRTMREPGTLASPQQGRDSADGAPVQDRRPV